MLKVKWRYDVSYFPGDDQIVFRHTATSGNKAESLLDYYREIYPKKSWLEIVAIVLPEIKTVSHPEKLKFYSR